MTVCHHSCRRYVKTCSSSSLG